MAKDIRTISMLICFAGSNRRVVVDPKKCVVNRAKKSFTYKAQYKADNGQTYMINATSIEGTNGSKAKVTITNRSGKQIIAERQSVDVRFYRYLFE